PMRQARILTFRRPEVEPPGTWHGLALRRYAVVRCRRSLAVLPRLGLLDLLALLGTLCQLLGALAQVRGDLGLLRAVQRFPHGQPFFIDFTPLGLRLLLRFLG